MQLTMSTNYMVKGDTEMNNTDHFYVNACTSVDSPSFIITQFPSSKYILNQIAVCIVNCIFIIPAVLLNGFSIFTILKSPILKGKSYFYLIAVQSMVDMAVATITVPSFTYLIYSEVIGTSKCVVIFVLTFTGLVPGGLSLAALCALTFERYTSILHPIAHRNHVNKRMFLIYFCCFAVVLFIGVPLATKSAIVYYFGMVTVIGLSLVLNAIAYIKIFVGLKKRFMSNNSNSNSDETNSSETGRKKRFLQESRLARSCAIVVVVFYVCYLPGLVLCLYYIQHDKLIYRVAHSWYVTNFALNSSINSLIFFWQRPLLRKEAAKVLKKIFET